MTAELIFESPEAWTQEPEALQRLADRAVEAALRAGLEGLDELEVPEEPEGLEGPEGPEGLDEQQPPPPALSLALINDQRMTELNGEFRDQAKPTNVLSWPNYQGSSPDAVIRNSLSDGPLRYWGDVALAGETVIREATAEKKAFEAHFSHLIIHGVLHLLGHDHIEDDQAERMEALETRVLNSLGYPDPYGDHEDAA